MEEGSAWRPTSEAEEASFAHKWCVHCLEFAEAEPWEDEFGGAVQGSCGLLEEAFYLLQPRELKIRDGQPFCAAFREDPSCPARCLKTMEMFG